jgi:hypothetical protein
MRGAVSSHTVFYQRLGSVQLATRGDPRRFAVRFRSDTLGSAGGSVAHTHRQLPTGQRYHPRLQMSLEKTPSNPSTPALKYGILKAI